MARSGVKLLIGFAVGIGVYVAVWRIGSRLSADAIGMAVGLVFGILAGIPTALLVLVSDRRRYADDDDRAPVHQPPCPQLPPVIIVQPQSQHTARWGEIDVAPAPTIDGTCTQYTQARPFGLLSDSRQPHSPA